MLGTILLAATAALVLVTPASASFGIWCTGPEGDAGGTLKTIGVGNWDITSDLG